MQTPGREPSMEDILASIKKVIAEEKDLRATGRPLAQTRSKVKIGRSRPLAVRRACRGPAGRPRPPWSRERPPPAAIARRFVDVAAASRRHHGQSMKRWSARCFARPQAWLDDHLPASDEHVNARSPGSRRLLELASCEHSEQSTSGTAGCSSRCSSHDVATVEPLRRPGYYPRMTGLPDFHPARSSACYARGRKRRVRPERPEPPRSDRHEAPNVTGSCTSPCALLTCRIS